MPCYNSPKDKANGILSTMEVGFWKVPIEVYLVLLFWLNLSYDDYPAQIGPFCGPLHLVSYMDSIITLSPIQKLSLFDLFHIFHILLYSLYMDVAKHAIHAHPEQSHLNGRHYNRKPAITKKLKITIVRNRWWIENRILTLLRAQYYQNRGPFASNGLEQIHSAIGKIFVYLRQQGIGIRRLPSIAYMQKLAIVIRRLKKLLNDYREEIQSKCGVEEIRMLRRMLKLCEEICSFQHIHDDIAMDEFKQYIMYYENASLDIGDYTDNLEWWKCIDRRSRLDYADKQRVWHFLDKIIQETPDLLSKNDGILPVDHQLLNLIQKSLRKHVTPGELQQIIRNQFIGRYADGREKDSNDDSDSYSDDDDEGKYDYEYEEDIYNAKITKNLSNKAKKHKELSCLIYLTYLSYFIYLTYLIYKQMERTATKI